MAERLSPVLSARDLPQAELWSARLDGELYQLGECFSPVDELFNTANRSRSIGSVVPGQLIAERHTAAWILGACAELQQPLELCSEKSIRVGADALALIVVRQVVIDATEFCWISGFRVTTPLRTAVDLARFSPKFGLQERELAINLAQLGKFGFPECSAQIEKRVNLPRKHRALARLGEALKGI